MSSVLLSTIVLIELISLAMAYKLWRGAESRWIKVGGTVVLLVPILGPLLYLFVFDQPGPQPAHLRNDGPRGEYTHAWIGLRGPLRKWIREKEKNSSEDGGNA